MKTMRGRQRILRQRSRLRDWFARLGDEILDEFAPRLFSSLPETGSKYGYLVL
jgi:hypothetical protein